jgi:hypothetical protein
MALLIKDLIPIVIRELKTILKSVNDVNLLKRYVILILIQVFNFVLSKCTKAESERIAGLP